MLEARQVNELIFVCMGSSALIFMFWICSRRAVVVSENNLLDDIEQNIIV
jgi:hypothetical protein